MRGLTLDMVHSSSFFLFIQEIARVGAETERVCVCVMERERERQEFSFVILRRALLGS